MGTLSGEVTDISFLSPFSMGVNSERKEFAPVRAKFFPLSVDPLLERLCSPRKQRKSQKLCPFVKMMEKHRGEHIHLKADINFHSITFSASTVSARHFFI